MQGINNELMLNAYNVKFYEIYCGSLCTKSLLLVNYRAVTCQPADLFVFS